VGHGRWTRTISGANSPRPYSQLVTVFETVDERVMIRSHRVGDVEFVITIQVNTRADLKGGAMAPLKILRPSRRARA
jgi:hypothetical protein